MSHIANRGDQSTSNEVILLAALNALATSATGEFIRKTSATTFENATPSGSGSGTVTTISVVTAQGVSGSVANATTTPAITLTLGALTGVTSLNGLVVTANTGVITTGTWNATVITGTYGGTGVNNGASTITIGGSVVFSGAFATTITVTGITGVTLPTSGTLVNSAVATLSSLVSIGTVTTGTWNATVVVGQYGGTGVANTGKTITLGGNLTTSGAFAATLTLTNTTTVTLPVSGTLATLAGTETFTNKRFTSRSATTAGPGATPSINTDNLDYAEFTALAAAITSMTTNLSGTPSRGDTLWISFTDNGTARAITWGTSFEASTVALPTTTVISTRLDVGFTWNVATSKWRCVAVA